ncbi:hypothetical protein A9W96_29195 [Mycobacterium sp. 1245852.3]|nr:hypothetical protein A9W96_29195 [Mycobacterium sp. 1245852.3]
MIITATLPVSFWVAASVILLVAITAGALGFWRHKQGLLATALLWMPALPILASVYLLICIVR